MCISHSDFGRQTESWQGREGLPHWSSGNGIAVHSSRFDRSQFDSAIAIAPLEQTHVALFSARLRLAHATFQHGILDFDKF